MPKITYIEHNGRQHVIETQPGKSVMQAAVENLVPGIVGDCGGACSCATCHCYVESAWVDKTGSADDTEQAMLEGALNVESNSRLSCQITMRAELDGLVVRLPASQF